jgi:hypothetical protein
VPLVRAPLLLLVLLEAGAPGCAFLRLNGCTRLAVCGQRSAYACGDDLICARPDGQTDRAEPIISSRNPCHICGPEM